MRHEVYNGMRKYCIYAIMKISSYSVQKACMPYA